MSVIRNAQITNTKLGIEDHGIFTFGLCLEISGGGYCWFGDVALDTYDDQEGRRVGTAKGFECIMQVMKVVGVQDWEDLKGKYIRVEDNGWGTPINTIGNLMEESWFNLKEFFEQPKEILERQVSE